MTRRKALLIALTVVVLVGGILGGIQIVRAIQGGNTDTEMTKSVARITYLGQTFCSGSVVGDGWVLTALHCYPGSLDANPQAWRQMGVQLWKVGANVSPGYESLLSERPIPMSGGFVSPDVNKQPNYRDVLLLHVATPMPHGPRRFPWR